MKNLCSTTQQSLLTMLNDFLVTKYQKVVKTDYCLYAQGTDPILLCAHLDTVFLFPPINIYTDKEAKVMWAPAGLGADDRAGVYAIMQIIADNFRPSVLFTTDEEVGCVGAKKVIMDYSNCPFKDIKFILQLDRCEYGQAVFYNCDNRIFKDWICSFGFREELGTYSDISVLCPYWEIAGANLSVGYYNEHSQAEYLKWEQLEYTIGRVELMFERVYNLDRPFRYIPKVLYNSPNIKNLTF